MIGINTDIPVPQYDVCLPLIDCAGKVQESSMQKAKFVEYATLIFDVFVDIYFVSTSQLKKLPEKLYDISETCPNVI